MTFYKVREEHKWKQWKEAEEKEIREQGSDEELCEYLVSLDLLTIRIILRKTFGYWTEDIAGIQSLLYLPGKENCTWCVMVKSAGCKYTYCTERRNRWRTEILPS